MKGPTHAHAVGRAQRLSLSLEVAPLDRKFPSQTQQFVNGRGATHETVKVRRLHFLDGRMYDPAWGSYRQPLRRALSNYTRRLIS